MTSPAKLRDLAQISALALDHRLAALRQAQLEWQSIKDRITALDRGSVTTDLSIAAAEKAEVNYQIWADQRRRQLNLQLAQATASVLQAEIEARQAFAQNSVLVALRARVAAAGGRLP